MRREQLEHVLRAASTVVGERDILVIGSQSILGTIPDEDLPLEATTSIEADLAFLPRQRSGGLRADATGLCSRQRTAIKTVVGGAGWKRRLTSGMRFLPSIEA